MKFTDEQKELARSIMRDAQRRAEMVIEDAEGEIEMRLGLEGDEVYELLEAIE